MSIFDWEKPIGCERRKFEEFLERLGETARDCQICGDPFSSEEYFCPKCMKKLRKLMKGEER